MRSVVFCVAHSSFHFRSTMELRAPGRVGTMCSPMHSFPQTGMLHIKLLRASGLRAANEASGPYAMIAVGMDPKPPLTMLQSRVSPQAREPKWDDVFAVPGAFDALCRGPLRVVVYAQHADGSAYERLGDATIDLRRVVLGNGRWQSITVPLRDGQPTPATVRLSLRWEYASQDMPLAEQVEAEASGAGVVQIHVRAASIAPSAMMPVAATDTDAIDVSSAGVLCNPYAELTLGGRSVVSEVAEATHTPQWHSDLFIVGTEASLLAADAALRVRLRHAPSGASAGDATPGGATASGQLQPDRLLGEGHLPVHQLGYAAGLLAVVSQQRSSKQKLSVDVTLAASGSAAEAHAAATLAAAERAEAESSAALAATRAQSSAAAKAQQQAQARLQAANDLAHAAREAMEQAEAKHAAAQKAEEEALSRSPSKSSGNVARTAAATARAAFARASSAAELAKSQVAVDRAAHEASEEVSASAARAASAAGAARAASAIGAAISDAGAPPAIGTISLELTWWPPTALRPLPDSRHLPSPEWHRVQGEGRLAAPVSAQELERRTVCCTFHPWCSPVQRV